MVKIEGLLVTKSPLHIASPEERRFDFRTMRFTNQKEAVPCTPTTKMGLVRPAEMRHETEEGTMIATEAVPVIPANDLRGRLRREAADIFFEHLLSERGEKLSLDTYHVMTCGAASGSPDKGDPELSYIQAAAKDPFLGVWGGGPKMLRSRLRVDTGFLVCPLTNALGIIPSGLQMTSVEPWQASMVMMFKRNDDALNFTNPITGAIVQDYAEAIESWREYISGAKAARAKAKEDKVKIKAGEVGAKLESWSTLELVTPGSPFFLRYEINGEDYHVGHVLYALERFFNKQDLGGWSRNGFGRYQVSEMNLIEDGVKAPAFVSAEGQILLNRNNAAVKGYLESFDQALSGVSAESLEALCVPKEKVA